MIRERFPKTRMTNQLRKLDWELTTWHHQYLVAADATEVPWLGARFLERTRQLERIQAHLLDARTELQELARLS